MSLVSFKKGLLTNLPKTYNEGTFYVATDERAIYLDTSATERIRLGDFQEFANLAALDANKNPSTSALYYVTDINCLAKWNGSDYVQINPDTGITSVEVDGDGNAVTAAVYDAAGRKLTLTKGATYMTASDVDTKIADVVGDIPADSEGEAQTVRQYIDAKTSGIATDAALSELQEKVDELQEIDHEAYKTADEQVLTEAKAYAEEQAEAVDTKLTEEVNRAKAAEEANAAAAKAADDKAVAAQEDVDALVAKVGEVPANKTVVQMISDAQTAATYDDTQVKADIAANAEAIQVEKERMDAFMTLEDGQTLNAALDSLKEIQDFITNEAADADVLLGKVSALEAIVAGIGGEGEPATVVAYVTAAIEALKIGDYAKAADLTALADRVAAMEAKVSNWDAAEQNAKDYADGLNTAMDNRVKALEEIDHEAYVAADEQVLSEAKGYADQAEADALAAAKEYVNGLDTAMDARVDALEAIDHNAYVAADATNLQAAKDYADGLADNYDAAGSAATAEATAKAYTDTALTWGSF